MIIDCRLCLKNPGTCIYFEDVHIDFSTEMFAVTTRVLWVDRFYKTCDKFGKKCEEHVKHIPELDMFTIICHNPEEHEENYPEFTTVYHGQCDLSLGS